MRWVYARTAIEDSPSASGETVSSEPNGNGRAVGVIQDITERKRADATRNLLASIVASSNDAIVSRDLDGIIRTWNHGAERLLLYSTEEAVGKPISMLNAPEQATLAADMRVRVDKGGRLEQVEMVAVRKDGSRVDVALTSSVLTDDEGTIHGASIIARDITERRRAEVALRRSQEQLRSGVHSRGKGLHGRWTDRAGHHEPRRQRARRDAKRWEPHDRNRERRD